MTVSAAYFIAGDLKVPLNQGQEISWSFKTGTKPHRQIFVVRAGFGARLETAGKIDFEIIDNNNESTLWTNLWVVRRLPSSSPGVDVIEVADRRWTWQKYTLKRSYNIPRSASFYRALTQNNPALQPVEQNLLYRKWSLFDEYQVWKAEDIFIDLINTIFQRDSIEQIYNQGNVFLKEGDTVAQSPVQDFHLDFSADICVQRVLDQYMSGMDLYIDRDGNVVLFNKISQGGFDLRDSLLPAYVGSHLSFDNINIWEVPKKIRVLFEPEVEVRGDFVEQNDESTAPTSAMGAFQYINVVPLPDFELEIAGKKEVYGSYIEINQYLQAIGAAPGFYQINPTLKTLRQQITGVNSFMRTCAEQLNSVLPRYDWIARTDALIGSHRRLFKIPDDANDWFKVIKPTRIQVVNHERATRAPAGVWADVSYLTTERSLHGQFNGATHYPFAINYAVWTGGRLDSAMKLFGQIQSTAGRVSGSPGKFRVVHQDQGIVLLDWVLQVGSDLNSVSPGIITIPTRYNIEPARGPAQQSTPKRYALAIDALKKGTSVPELATPWYLTTVFTVEPYIRDERLQLFPIELTPGDVAAFLSPSALASAQIAAAGPTLDIRVGPNVATAWILWNDDRRQDIIKLLFPNRYEVTPTNFNGLVLNANADLGATILSELNAPNLNLIAQTIAARVWESRAIHPEGTMIGYYQPGIEPTGWVESIKHGLDKDGVLFTEVIFPPYGMEFDFKTLLDDNTLKVILRLVDQIG